MSDQLIVGLIVGWVVNIIYTDFIKPIFTNLWNGSTIDSKCTGNCNQGRNCNCK